MSTGSRYQTKMKGEEQWSEPEVHQTYLVAAELELDVFFSSLDDEQELADRQTVMVRSVDGGTTVDVHFERNQEGRFDCVGSAVVEAGES